MLQDLLLVLNLTLHSNGLDLALAPEGQGDFLGFFEDYRVCGREEKSPGKAFFRRRAKVVHQRLFCRLLASLQGLFDPPPFSFPLPSPWVLPSGPKLSFFAGSFNPWHSGHGRCVSLAGLPNLIVAPDQSPWKGDTPSPFSLLGGIPLASDLCLFPGFLGRDESNPTAQWVCALRARGLGITLVLGEDCFGSIHRWQEAEALLEALEGLVVIPRLKTMEDFEKQRDKILGSNGHLAIERRSHHDTEGLSSRAQRASRA